MEYLQVRIPMMEVIPLRQAEEGATLEFDAFSRDGKLIAEEGTTLTEDLIERFRNFNVRKVVVTSPREQWIPREDRDELPSNAEVLQQQEFSEAAEEILGDVQNTESTEKMRKTALYLRRQASRAGNDEEAEYLDDLIERTERLEDEIERLTEKLDSVDDEEARAEIMDALEGKVRQLEETFMEVSAPDSMLKDTLNVVNEREDIRSSLANFVHDNLDLVNQEYQDGGEEIPEAVDLEDVDDELVSAISHFNDGESVEGVAAILEDVAGNEGRVSHDVEETLNDLHRQLTRQRETVEKFKQLLSEEVQDLEARKTLIDVLEGRKTVNRMELMELPISRSFASKTYDLVEDRMESHHRIWDALEEITDGEMSNELDRSQFLDRSIRKSPEDDEEKTGDPDKGGTVLSDGQLVEVLDAVTDDNPRAGLEKLERVVERSDHVGPERKAEIVMVREQLSDVEERKNAVLSRIQSEVEDESVRETLEAFVTGDRSFNPDELMSMDADMKLLEEIGDFITERNSTEQDAWQAVDDASGGALRGESGERSEVVQEKIDDAADVLQVNQRSSRSWGEKDEEESSPGSSSPVNGDGQSILELVAEGDEYDISNETGLDVSEVKAADTLLAEPDGMSGDQQIIFEPLAREMKTLFYGRHANEDDIRDSVKSMSAELEAENRPYKLMMEPPSDEEYILTHGLNTTMVTVLLGHYFDLNESEMLDVTAASLASDLGMVTIPPALWLKDESLTQRGEKEVQRHPDISDEIVSTAFNNDEVIGDLVGQHHERVDGSGYPHYIDKDQQHPLAPIVAAADAYTAMVEPRPYRGAEPPNRALVSMLKSQGQYDRAVVKGLVETIGIYPNGSVALLEDKRLGLVHSQNGDHPLKPNVLLLTDKSRNRLDDPRPLDVSDPSTPSINQLVRY